MYTTRVTRHVNAPRAAVYAALIDADALPRWRVPDGMTGRVHAFDAREGGAFRISLTYDAPAADGKSRARTDTYHGRFLRLVPDEQVVEEFEFETPDDRFRGLMTMTTTLTDAAPGPGTDTHVAPGAHGGTNGDARTDAGSDPAGGGTDVLVVHEGIPDAVPAADNEAGTRMALANLAALVEAHSDGNATICAGKGSRRRRER